jgi:hypothetical protein
MCSLVVIGVFLEIGINDLIGGGRGRGGWGASTWPS